MTTLKVTLSVTAVATLMSVGALIATATPASAYVVCNRDGGDCWHSDTRPRAPGVTFDVHPDDWYFHQNWSADSAHHFRDYHPGRGYYRGGIWITL
jgi:hypothetical protein